MDTKTIETYNATAQEYDNETKEFWEKFPRTMLETFVQVSGSKVLDVGSGPGRDGLLLQANGKDVVCLDASSQMVRISTDRGLQSMVGDFLHIPFENNSFDGVWAYTSLLHVPKSDAPRAIQEIRRVLRPGGIFGLGLIEGENEMYRTSSGVQMDRWFSYYKRSEVEQLLRDHAFEVIFYEDIQPRSKKYLHVIAKKV